MLLSQPTVTTLALPHFELVYEDGEPLESEWHGLEHTLLRNVIRQAMQEQSRTDFYVGTNMFVYYSVQQARDVAEEVTNLLPERAFRGPDAFWVGGVPNRRRKCWIAWEEGGRLPDVIVELVSSFTVKRYRTERRDLYAQVFRTAEHFLYDPDTGEMEGLHLVDQSYQPILPDEKGRLWSGQLGCFFGLWQGIFEGSEDDWVRLFRPDGTLVPTEAEAAEAELARLRAALEECTPKE
jgi:Uma2 family endonuclease